MIKRNQLIAVSVLLRVILLAMLCCGAHYAYRVGYTVAHLDSVSDIGRLKAECQGRVDTGVQTGCYRAVTMGCGDSTRCLMNAQSFCDNQVE